MSINYLYKIFGKTVAVEFLAIFYINGNRNYQKDEKERRTD